MKSPTAASSVVPTSSVKSTDVSTKNAAALPTASVKIQVASLPIYSDLAGHWVQQTATKLRYLGILDPDPLFEPKRIVSEQDISLLYLKIFGTMPAVENLTLQPDHILSKGEALNLILMGCKTAEASEIDLNQSTPLDTIDVPETDHYYTLIKQSLQYCLITSGKKLSLAKPITRAELIAILAKIPRVQKQIKETFVQ